MILQKTPPRDWFDDCTVSVAAWLQKPTVDDGTDDRLRKWNRWISVCAMVRGLGKLRQEPRVGYDPVRDQEFFLFKEDNNGTTWWVSSQGLAFEDDDLW